MQTNNSYKNRAEIEISQCISPSSSKDSIFNEKEVPTDVQSTTIRPYKKNKTKNFEKTENSPLENKTSYHNNNQDYFFKVV